MAIVKNAVSEMEIRMAAEDVHQAHAYAEQEILSIRLAELRGRKGMKQSDLKNFSQTAASRLERRKDMKISTLIEYLDDLGMGLEIKVYDKSDNSEGSSEILLRV